MSVAGGVSRAVDRAALHGCEALQIFTKNASRWASPPLDADEVRRFRARIEETGIGPAVSHASYLINLGSAAPALRAQSIAALVDELDRAHTLGLAGVVLHPGTATSGTDEAALELIAAGLRDALAAGGGRRTPVLLEHTAGQGRTLGWRFEQLASILERVDDPDADRVGVCLDTCHLIAAGYDIVSPEGYARTFEEFDRVIGLDRLRVFHANDSKKPCASRVDRHEHIGEGCLGLAPFARLLHDARFSGLPMLIETRKSTPRDKPGAVAVDPLDIRNLDTLRRLRGTGLFSTEAAGSGTGLP
jgi:deoxyribonuclease-4